MTNIDGCPSSECAIRGVCTRATACLNQETMIADLVARIEQTVANRIADWLDENQYLAPTQLIREGRWRK